MTRRSIAAVLASLLVGLLVTVNAPAVGACELDGSWNCAAPEALVSVASVGPAVAVQDADARFLEINTITLPSVSDALAANAAPALTMAQYQFIEMNTILPSAGMQTYMEDLTPIPGRPY
jgi:hypothetical protein